MSVAVQDPAVRDALIRASVYETLSMGFAYPDPQGFERLTEVAELARAEASVLDEDLPSLIGAVVDVVSATDAVGMEPEHTRLFAGEVVCSPHETEYETHPFSKTRQLADVVGFYRAFGVEISEEHKTMADFIGTETEFMALLCRKEAHAAASGWEERREVTADAQRAFLESHLGRWTGVFCAELRKRVRPDGGALYLALAELLERFVAQEVARMGVAPILLEHRMLSVGDTQPAMCDPRVVGCVPSPEPSSDS